MTSLSAKMTLCIAALQCQKVFAAAVKSKSKDLAVYVGWRGSAHLVQAPSRTSLQDWGSEERVKARDALASTDRDALPSFTRPVDGHPNHSKRSLPMTSWLINPAAPPPVAAPLKKTFRVHVDDQTVDWLLPAPKEASSLEQALQFAPGHLRDAQCIRWGLPPHGRIVATKKCKTGMLGSKSTYWSYQIHLNGSEQEVETFRIYGLKYRNKYLYSKFQFWNQRVKSIDLAMLFSLAECMDDAKFRIGLDLLTRMVPKTHNLYRIDDPM